MQYDLPAISGISSIEARSEEMVNLRWMTSHLLPRGGNRATIPLTETRVRALAG